MVVLQARAQLQETINAQDTGKTNTWVTLQPPFTVVLKAGEHTSCLLFLLIACVGAVSLSLSVSPSLSTTLYEGEW
jgi:hypothetical protein